MKKTIYTLSCEMTDKYNELAFVSHAEVIKCFRKQEADIQELLIRGELFIILYQPVKVEVVELGRRILIDY